MQHIVADPEPPQGDDQSFRRRGMRVRSWKESFQGWDFSTVDGDYRYVWGDLVKKGDELPPDFFETEYTADWKVASSNSASQSVWTPPIAIDLNKGATLQSGDVTDKTFGQYMMEGQSVSRDEISSSKNKKVGYNGKYDDRIYGRLSLGRPWGNTLPNQTTPVFGLYAMRGWDFGTSKNDVYDSTGNTLKRFLGVVQGLHLPYRPHPESADIFRREPQNETYGANRERVLGLHSMVRATGSYNYQTPLTVRIYDIWIGEGFSPREVRAILGLTTTNSEDIRGTYVHPDMEKEGFYVP
jgi:hypothetical protein